MNFTQAIRKIKDAAGPESSAFIELRHSAINDKSATVDYRASIVWGKSSFCVGCNGDTLVDAVAGCIAAYHAKVAVVGEGRE